MRLEVTASGTQMAARMSHCTYMHQVAFKLLALANQHPVYTVP
jgi:hypothetical protein